MTLKFPTKCTYWNSGLNPKIWDRGPFFPKNGLRFIADTSLVKRRVRFFDRDKPIRPEVTAPLPNAVREHWRSRLKNLEDTGKTQTNR